MRPSARRGLGAAVVAAGVLTTTAVPVFGFPGREHAQEAFETTNQVRDRHDRARLEKVECLQRKAVQHAVRMAEQERMFHQDLREVLRDCGMQKVGENVAFGFETGESTVRDGWMQSDSHRRNLLDREYRLMGLASRRDDDGTFYTSQVFGVR